MGRIIYLNLVGGNKVNLEIDDEYNRIDRITRVADEVINRYGIIDFPVEPTIIARKLNIPIKEVTFKKHKGYLVSGGIIKENDELIIYVNSQESMERKRFTIAHELGHYFLNHMDNKGQYVDLHRELTYDKSVDEVAADEFAACLLMPEEIIKDKYKLLGSLGFSKDMIINKLAEIFFVSKSAMKHRLENLSLIK